MIKALNLNSLVVGIRSKQNIEYLDVECAFDIETTSMTLDDGTDVGFMYAWAFGMKNKKHMVMGRTWEQFSQLMGELSNHYSLGKSRKMVVYVHNLGFEFQFMRKYFKWGNVFTVDEREPIIAQTTNGIEFRDSYILSGYSLDKTAKMLTKHDTKKLTGDLDYSLIRHHETELTTEEVQYMVNDVQIILDYINEQRELYGSITKIPITNTKRVREYVRNHCFYDNNRGTKKASYGRFTRYTEVMSGLTLTPETYLQSKQAFQGGYVHANSDVLDKELTDVISYDIKSSYPSVMVTEQYPMSEGKKVVFTKDMGYKDYLKEHVLIFDAKFTNLIRKENVHEDYLSESKCRMEDALINNGRVQGAHKLITTITNIDLKIINRVYNYDSVQFANVYAYRKGYLPKAIIESVITLFKNKSTLKGEASKELEAQLSKELLNSTYGMMVTDVVKNKVEYNNKTDSWETNMGDVEKEIDKYNSQYRRFLYYPWGVFVSAYARLNLWYAILAVKEDYVYSDTDSVKFTNPKKYEEFFKQYNKLVDMKLQRVVSMNRGITMDDFNPLDPTTGELSSLGHFEVDGHYKRFKTIGAKMYLAETQEEELEVTVSGLNKNQGREYLIAHSENNAQAFELFKDNMTIPKEYSGKMTHKYIDREYTFNVTDYKGKTARVTALSGIYMEGSEFTIDKVKIAKRELDDLINGVRPAGNHRLR